MFFFNDTATTEIYTLSLHDALPILNGGWCYGGFKATPGSGWVYAHTIANDAPHPLNEAYTLERFARGRMIDERGAGANPALH